MHISPLHHPHTHTHASIHSLSSRELGENRSKEQKRGEKESDTKPHSFILWRVFDKDLFAADHFASLSLSLIEWQVARLGLKCEYWKNEPKRECKGCKEREWEEKWDVRSVVISESFHSINGWGVKVHFWFVSSSVKSLSDSGCRMDEGRCSRCRSYLKAFFFSFLFSSAPFYFSSALIT